MEKTRSQMLAIPADGREIENPGLLEKRLREAADFQVESMEPEENTLCNEV